MVSTLIIAALFTPLRIRIQMLIDRRFYRQKYDTQLLMQDFNVRIRAGVDLEEITRHLVAVTGDTLQPDQISLWMRVKGKSD